MRKNFLFKQYYLEVITELIKSGLPILFLFVSLLFYMHDKPEYHLPNWQAASGDAGDYRYLAEHFWGLPHRIDTYNPVFSGHWAFFLDHVPFRQIGVGTFYVLFIELFYRQAGIHTQLEAAAYWLPLILTGFMIISYLFFYTACRMVWGWKPALAAFVCLIFPPHYWALAGDLLSEPFLRICLVNVLALLVLLQKKRHTGTKVALLYFFLLLAVQIRSQWLLFAFFLLPFLVLLSIDRKRYGLIVSSLGLSLLLPLSLYLVNVIGWGYPAVTTCTGFHVNLKTNGELIDYVAAQIARQRAAQPSKEIRTPVYLQSGRRDDWWHIPFPLPTQRNLPSYRELQSDYLLLDKYTSAYLFADWQGRILKPLIEGCTMLTNFPGGVFGDARYMPPPLFYRMLDGIVVAILVGGLVFKKSRLLSAAGLSLWLVPATGNILSIYVVRYLRPMAMMPFALALLVAFIITSEALAKSKAWKSTAGESLLRTHNPAREE